MRRAIETGECRESGHESTVGRWTGVESTNASAPRAASRSTRPKAAVGDMRMPTRQQYSECRSLRLLPAHGICLECQRRIRCKAECLNLAIRQPLDFRTS
jgi:hypothetical protein